MRMSVDFAAMRASHHTVGKRLFYSKADGRLAIELLAWIGWDGIEMKEVRSCKLGEPSPWDGLLSKSRLLIAMTSDLCVAAFWMKKKSGEQESKEWSIQELPVWYFL